MGKANNKTRTYGFFGASSTLPSERDSSTPIRVQASNFLCC
jgi:hypothetical protein